MCAESQLAPWYQRGVVSLLDMLEFAARDFLDLSHNVGMMLGALQRLNRQPGDLGQSLGQSLSGLPEKCKRLNLPVTAQFMGEWMVEAFAGMTDQEKAESLALLRTTGEVHVKTNFSAERMVQHVETIYRSLRIELSSLLLRVIPREKAKYCNEQWLQDSPGLARYPDTIEEFQRAGRCYAYGENTACVFHLMRVAEFYLTKVAQSLQADFDPLNWSAIGKLINKNMEQKYQTKTDDWKSKEPFYAEILMDIQALSRAHRHPALHDLEKKYEEREAGRLLSIIEGFAAHVAENL